MTHHVLNPDLKAAAPEALIRRGCVTVIELYAIKASAGARWDKMRETIYARLEAILRQKLGATDFFAQMNETSYLVTMPSCEPDDAHICCLRIAFELHTSLLGDCRLADLRISRLLQSDGDAVVLEAIGEPAITHLVKRAGLHEHLSPPLPQANAPAVRAQPILPVALPPVKFVHRFAPFWDVRLEAVATWRCLTIPADSLARTAEEHTRDRLAQALSAIGRSMSILSQRLRQREKFLLSIPIGHELLSSPVARMELADTCRNLPGEVRPYVLFEITDLPPGVPHSRMNDLITVLRPFAKAVLVHMPLRNPSFASYQGLGVHAEGIHLDNSMTQSDACNEIERICAGARLLHSMTFLTDVANVDVLRAACKAGVNLVSGPVIGGTVPEPLPMRRLFAREILQKAAGPSQAKA
ncbi:MAG: hypothetical protein ACXWLQ_00410 [Rhizomicrobium sp.]